MNQATVKADVSAKKIFSTLLLKYRIRIAETISALLIFLFVYTSLSKLSIYTEFKDKLSLFPVINHFNVFLSWAVPGAELLVSMLLFIPKTRLIGLYGSFVLLSLFTIYLGLMIFFGGEHLPCTCGGVIQRMTWKQHTFFNAGFILLTAFAIVLQKKNIQQ